MWKGWLIEESLENNSVLSELKIINSAVERNIEGDEVQIWHLNTVEVDDKQIGKIAGKLEKLMKFGYYVHFTDYRKLLIIFRGKYFLIELEKVIKEKEFGAVEFKAKSKDLKLWKKAFDYGTAKGKVDPRYIIKVM